MSYSLLATFTALPGRSEEVARLIADFAIEVRREEGCLLFEPYTVMDLDHDFVVFEKYVDEDAFETHLRSPAGPAFNAALEERVVGTGSILQLLHEVSE